MANSGRKANRTTIVKSDGGPSAQVDPDSKQTQVRRGQPMATIKVVDGPGAGSSHAIYKGDNAIGRSGQNRIALSFGDDAIHREGHAWICAQNGEFAIEHGGKSNPVYVNGQELTGRRPLELGDQITLGATTLRLEPV